MKAPHVLKLPTSLDELPGGSLAVLTPPISVKGSPVTGKGDNRKATLTLANNGSKSVKGYVLDESYITAGGKILAESGYGSMSTASILDAGKGTLISGGEPPPAGAVSVKIVVSDAEFTDGSKWAPGK